MKGISSRANSIKPSPTLAVSAKAKSLKAQGIDVIGFGAGEPDFDTPDYIKIAAKKAIDDGFTKYTPEGGIDELKDAVIEKFKRDNGLEYSRKEVLISCGAKHSIYNLCQAVLDPDDEVIIIAPYWVSYPDMALLAGAKPVIVETSEKSEFKVSPVELEKAITNKTRLIILNSPSNPTGSAYTEQELRNFTGVLEEADSWILSDEIYESIVYDGFKPVSIASLSKKLKEKTIVVNGVSKTYSMTGWRIGYSAGDEAVISAMSKIQGQSTSNPTSISQKAALCALKGGDGEVKKMVKEFKERRDFIVSALNSLPGVSCFNPRGAFYVFPNFSSYLGKSFEGKEIGSSVELSEFLLEKAKVAVVPGSAFGGEGYLRLSYATSMKNIKEGIKRIEEALKLLG